MVDFILFVLLVMTAYYAYSTRQRLVTMANTIDSINALIEQAIADDRNRLDKIEKSLVKRKLV